MLYRHSVAAIASVRRLAARDSLLSFTHTQLEIPLNSSSVVPMSYLHRAGYCSSSCSALLNRLHGSRSPSRCNNRESSRYLTETSKVASYGSGKCVSTASRIGNTARPSLVAAFSGWHGRKTGHLASSRRCFAVAAEAIARSQMRAEDPSFGCLVHFYNGNGDLSLGLVLEFQGGAADILVEDAKGIVHGVKRRDVVYVLPSEFDGKMTISVGDEEVASNGVHRGVGESGSRSALLTDGNGINSFESAKAHGRKISENSRAELLALDAEIERYKEHAMKQNLLNIAWDVSEPEAMYSVSEMAGLLFDGETPATCAAAHALLHEETLLFRQVGRRPPMYASRVVEDVKSLVISQTGRETLETLRESFLAALEEARALPSDATSEATAWKEGPHAVLITALEHFALGKSTEVSLKIEVPRSPIFAGDDGDVTYAITTGEVLELLDRAGVVKSPQGASQLLRTIGFWPRHAVLGLLKAGLSDATFPDELELAARALVADPPEDKDAQFRKDMTHLEVITVDDAETLEVDDGLSAEFVGGSSDAVRVWIHVSDPTRWIDPESVLDLEARRRTRTLYLPTTMIPMFPKPLSWGLFSLQCNGRPTPAFTISCIIRADGSLEPGSVEVTASMVKPSRQLTYDDADEILIECTPEEEPIIHALDTAASWRKKHRFSSGAVEFQFPEAKFTVLDERAELPDVNIEIKNYAESRSRQIIAEMMILAGETCARLGGSLGIPLPYRGQQSPLVPTDEEYSAVPPGLARSAILRSRMLRSSTIANGPQKHAGLGLEAYAQVTSPIRRYGDLLVHWQLKAALRGEELPFSTSRMADILEGMVTSGQSMTKLEREAHSYWVAQYFKRALLEDPGAVWRGTFLAWFKQDAGLAKVALDDLGLEMLVKLVTPATPGRSVLVKCSVAEPLTNTVRLEEAAAKL